MIHYEHDKPASHSLMPYSAPRTTTKSDYFIVEFAAPEADAAAFYVEVWGDTLYVRGRYAADVSRQRYSLYARGGGRIDASYKIPVPVTSDTRYIKASYADDVLRVYFRRADDFGERRVRIYVR